MNPPQEGLERPQASVLMLPLSPHFSLSIAFCGYFIDGICLVPFLLLSLPESLEPRLPNSFPLQGLALWVQAAALYAG